MRTEWETRERIESLKKDEADERNGHVLRKMYAAQITALYWVLEENEQWR